MAEHRAAASSTSQPTIRADDRSSASILSIFDPSQLPGALAQPEIFRYQASIDVNTRQPRGNPRRGGRYALTYQRFDDSTGATGSRSTASKSTCSSTSRCCATGESWRCTRCVSTSDADDGAEVPFYLQRTLGGPDDLRGFRHLRFRDRNIAAAPGGVPLGDLHRHRRRDLLRRRQGRRTARGSRPQRSRVRLRHRLQVRHHQRRVSPRRGRVRQLRGRALHLEIRSCLLNTWRTALSGPGGSKDPPLRSSRSLACVALTLTTQERHAGVLPGRSAAGGQRSRARCRQGEADRRQQRLRLRRAHVLQARRSPADPRGQRQHAGRSPGLDLVHQPHRPPGDVDRRDRARPQRRGHSQHRRLADRRRQEQRDHPRVSRRRSRRPPVSGEVRSAEQSGDGQQRRSDRRRLLSRARLQRRPGVHRRRGPGEDRHRAHGHHGGHARAQEAHDARATSTNCSRAARSCPTANTARRSAGSPTADRSATSSTTARAPTIRTTSTRTSIAASCAPIASLPPG